MSICAICQGLSRCCWNHSFLSSPLTKIRVWERCLKRNSSHTYLFNYLLGTHRTQTHPLMPLRLTFICFLLPTILKLTQTSKHFCRIITNWISLQFTGFPEITGVLSTYVVSAWDHKCCHGLTLILGNSGVCQQSAAQKWAAWGITANPDRSTWDSDTSLSPQWVCHQHNIIFYNSA